MDEYSSQIDQLAIKEHFDDVSILDHLVLLTFLQISSVSGRCSNQLFLVSFSMLKKRCLTSTFQRYSAEESSCLHLHGLE